MERTELIMGMPVKIVVARLQDAPQMDDIFTYFTDIDERFSTYKPASEISRINAGLPQGQWSADMRAVLALCEQTKRETNGYFDVMHNGTRDPSGLVKGWAIYNAAQKMRAAGIYNFYIDAGGDIQTSGHNAAGAPWRIGIRNPFNRDETVKTVQVSGQGVATSGTYIRGQHVYDPHSPTRPQKDIVSLTVIGPNIYEADRFATAAFAMGKQGINFIDALNGFEGYVIDPNGTATLTSGFEEYAV